MIQCLIVLRSFNDLNCSVLEPIWLPIGSFGAHNGSWSLLIGTVGLEVIILGLKEGICK